MSRRVLITGVASHFGTELARRLEADPAYDHVAGLDTQPPRGGLERTEFIEADIRGEHLAGLLAGVRPDTVVHNQIVRRPGPGMSAGTAHDINVIGSLQLLTACEQTETIEAIVIRGSAGVYGSEPAAPQFFDEEMTRMYPRRTRFQRDAGEIEAYFETYANSHPSVTCTMLRYQPAIGPSVETQITRYLALAAPPTYLGFDPRLQLIHEDDALDALVAAVERPVRGAVNVAGPGTVGLTRMIRMAGKFGVPVPSPLFGVVASAGKRAGMLDFSEDFRRLLRYGRGVDTRRLTDDVGFTPRFSTEAAIEDYAAQLPHQGMTAPLRNAVRV